jgi:predicted Zn-ribbon and HTH transcriptional regulator
MCARRSEWQNPSSKRGEPFQEIAMFTLDDATVQRDAEIDAAETPAGRGQDLSAIRVTVATECRSCGYETDGARPTPRRCPKCGASSWARFARITGATGATDRPSGVRGTSKRSFDRPTHRFVGGGR